MRETMLSVHADRGGHETAAARSLVAHLQKELLILDRAVALGKRMICRGTASAETRASVRTLQRDRQRLLRAVKKNRFTRSIFEDWIGGSSTHRALRAMMDRPVYAPDEMDSEKAALLAFGRRHGLRL
ncbi:MAG: hypothetical protein QM570_18285 [Planctomycetota bacterium]|jgi:hypothetical protein|nr:hypothetical protein [Planctomycetota bacterium]